MQTKSLLTIVAVVILISVFGMLITKTKPKADVATATNSTGIEVTVQGNFQVKETSKSRVIGQAEIYDSGNHLLYSYPMRDDMAAPTFIYDQSTTALPPVAGGVYTVKLRDVNPAFTIVSDDSKSVTVSNGRLQIASFQMKADNTTGDIYGGVQSFYGPSLKDDEAKMIVKDTTGKVVATVPLTEQEGFNGLAGDLQPGDYQVELVLADSKLTIDDQTPATQTVSVKANSNSTIAWRIKTK
jgi:hypothetical protein